MEKEITPKVLNNACCYDVFLAIAISVVLIIIALVLGMDARHTFGLFAVMLFIFLIIFFSISTLITCNGAEPRYALRISFILSMIFAIMVMDIFIGYT